MVYPLKNSFSRLEYALNYIIKFIDSNNFRVLELLEMLDNILKKVFFSM